VAERLRGAASETLRTWRHDAVRIQVRGDSAGGVDDFGARRARRRFEGRAYFGGTLAVLGSPKDPVEGRLDTSNEQNLVFGSFEKEFAGKSFCIPYKNLVHRDG
jgi:hypothetical protein